MRVRHVEELALVAGLVNLVGIDEDALLRVADDRVVLPAQTARVLVFKDLSRGCFQRPSD
jgi:hypothetical protein